MKYDTYGRLTTRSSTRVLTSDLRRALRTRVAERTRRAADRITSPRVAARAS